MYGQNNRSHDDKSHDEQEVVTEKTTHQYNTHRSLDGYVVYSVVSIVGRRYLLIKGMEELSKVLSDWLLEYVKYMISASTTAGRLTFGLQLFYFR